MSKKTNPPFVHGKHDAYPEDFICPWCKERRIGEPHSMAILHGGALAKNSKGVYGAPTKGVRGILEFYWHGAHDGGEGEHRGMM